MGFPSVLIRVYGKGPDACFFRDGVISCGSSPPARCPSAHVGSSGLIARFCLTLVPPTQVTVPGVENADLSSIIGSNHFNYMRRMPELLAELALDDCSRYISRGDEEPLPSAGVIARTDSADLPYY